LRSWGDCNRSGRSLPLASMQQGEASLRTLIDKAEDELSATNDQLDDLAEHESALRSLLDVTVDWPTHRDRVPILEAQVAEQRTARAKAAAEVGASRTLLQTLESDIADISEAIRRSDEDRAEFQELLASLESHAAGKDCPLCGQEYNSHEDLIGRIRAKSAQDPLSEVRNNLANKRTIQLEAQSRYAAARRILQTSETQLVESERVNEIHRQRIQNILTKGAEIGFALDAPDFEVDAIVRAAGEVKAELAARSERAKEQKQAVDQTRATLASAMATMKRRQEEIARTDTLLDRQRIELSRLQADSRYSEALITATAEVRNERKSQLERLLRSVQLSAAEAEQATLKRAIMEVARRITGINAQIQQSSRREMDLRGGQSTAIQAITETGLAADTSNDELLLAVSATTKTQSDLEILKEKAVSLEVGLDAAASAAILDQHRTTISTNDKQVKELRFQQRKLRDAERYFNDMHGVVSRQQNEAISNFTAEYGPRTSVIQRRLRSVYSFDDVEIRANEAKITVRVKRNGEELRPVDFFSQPQQQTLMLGLFLTACTAQTWSSFSTVFLDDPVTHFDDLNTYALLDLISRLLESADGGKQFIISTCDDRFLELARQKFRAHGDRAKFYQFAGVRPVGPLVPEPWPASLRNEPADAVVATCAPGESGEHAPLRERWSAAVKLFSNEKIAPGTVRIEQDGGGFECAIDALVYEPGDDSGTTMTVNPVDVDVAMMRWFAPTGRLN
jgi:DNA repair protein SbcC/Rad50